MITFGEIKERIAFISRHNFLFFRMMKEIERAEKLTPADLEALTRKKVMNYIRAAAHSSPFYAKLYRSIKLDGPFEEVYPQLPTIDKEVVRKNEKEILTMSPHLLVRAHTSGTSGSPLIVYRSPRAILKENAYLLYFKIKHGMRLNDRMISLRGKLDNSRLSYFNKAENTLYLSSYLLSPENAPKYAQLLSDFKPRVVHAYPSSALTLANILDEAGYRFEIPLIFTSSESLYPYQRERVERFFNAKIFDWYGNTERTTVLAQCEFGNYHEMPLYGVNEFSINSVTSTSIINRAFPLIRYTMTDGFTVTSEGCACGKSPVINSIDGRIDDSVILPGGKIVARLDLVFKNVPHVRFAQIIQDDETEIRINIVPTSEYNSETQNLILNNFHHRVNDPVNVSFHMIEEKDIIKSRSGKFKLVVSKVPQP